MQTQYLCKKASAGMSLGDIQTGAAFLSPLQLPPNISSGALLSSHGTHAWGIQLCMRTASRCATHMASSCHTRGIQLCPTHAEEARGSEIHKWPSAGGDGVFTLLCGYHKCDVCSCPTVPMPAVQALPTQQHSALVPPPSPRVAWERLR